MYNFEIFFIIIGVYAHFRFVLVDLINGYKNIYSRNNNVCFGGYLRVFMRIDTFKDYF